jgi:hypothetical protein
VPYFSRWGEGAEVPPRYRQCRPYADKEVGRVLARLRPGDRVVLVANLAGYLGGVDGPTRRSAEASYAAALREIDGEVRRRGAELVLFGPLPTFPQEKIGGPLSLCQAEWFRPAWSLGPQCQPVLRPRQQALAESLPVQRLQEGIIRDLPGTRLFSPFDSLCPPEQRVCSSVLAGTLLYSDNNHLTNAGALLLYPRLMAFLADQPGVEPPPS